MQSIKVLQKFISIVTEGVIRDDKFRDIHVYNTDISISDDMVIDDEFYQCHFRTATSGGILLLNLDKIEYEMLDFCIYHKIIKAITDFNETDQSINYSHYYIGNLYYKKNDTRIYGVDDNNHTLFQNIAVKTILNDTKTNETIDKIIALDDDTILLNLLKP